MYIFTSQKAKKKLFSYQLQFDTISLTDSLLGLFPHLVVVPKIFVATTKIEKRIPNVGNFSSSHV